MRRFAIRVCVGTLVATAALAGCSGHGRHNASVASSFGVESGVSSMPSPGQASSGQASSGQASSGQASSGLASSAPTPCPVAAPQIFVEGKQAATSGGQVTFSYLEATRICSGDESARYLTTGKSLTTKPVSPSAVILLLAPGGGTDELQVPPAALPAAIASGKAGPPYFTITVDASGAITRIEQAYLP